MFKNLINFIKDMDGEKCFFCNECEILDCYICEDCLDNLEFHEREFTRLESIKSVFIVLRYNDFIKKVIHNFKFNDKVYLYKALGELLIREAINTKIYEKIDLVTSVPLSIKSLKKRGYNQSHIIANYFCENLSLNYSENLIEKSIETKMQIELSYSERLSNIKTAFRINDSKAVENKKILIIDDVFTTGATLEACGQTLINAGAKEVLGLCLASPAY